MTDQYPGKGPIILEIITLDEPINNITKILEGYDNIIIKCKSYPNYTDFVVAKYLGYSTYSWFNISGKTNNRIGIAKDMSYCYMELEKYYTQDELAEMLSGKLAYNFDDMIKTAKSGKTEFTFRDVVLHGGKR